MSLTPEDLPVMRALYDAEVHYLDTQHIRLLFTALRKLELLDRTVVVVSLHGENLGEHGLLSHVACLYEPLVHIPLILRYPDAVPANLRVKSLVQLTDIVPTPLALSGVDCEGLELQGTSLLPLEAQRSYRSYAVAEWGGGGFTRTDMAEDIRLYHDKQEIYQKLTRKLTMLRVGDYKYIGASDGSEELFNLRSDPHELTNLAGSELPRIAQMAAHLKGFKAWEIVFAGQQRGAKAGQTEAIKATNRLLTSRQRSLEWMDGVG